MAVARTGVNTHAIQFFGFGPVGAPINTAGIFTGTDIYSQDATPDGIEKRRVRSLLSEVEPAWKFQEHFEEIGGGEEPPDVSLLVPPRQLAHVRR